ncbi:MAG: hypothetical protein U0271_39215 [Polyangiaceae bacterium]
MSTPRRKGAKDCIWGGIGFVVGVVMLWFVFSTVQSKGQTGAGTKGLVAGGGLLALLGSIKMSQGIVAMVFGVTIDVEEFESLRGRDKTYTVLFAVGWLFGLFALLGVALKYGQKWW